MSLPGLSLDHPSTPLPAPLPMWHATVEAEAWLRSAQATAACGGRLVALWGVDRRREGGALTVCAALATAAGLHWLDLPLPDAHESYPDLSSVFPCAVRMQRAAADLVGIRAQGAADQRPWLDHGLWPHPHPLRSDVLLAPAAASSRDGASASASASADATAPPRPGPGDYPFVRVQGEGVHEIPVGPVHAGIIEPGHFRFSVVGEKVLRLEQRLGYVHKGIEKRFTQLPALQAHRLAGRVSGDSTVAWAWAYVMALESALQITVPPRAAWLRALLLERERVANHLGDLGALGNDAALAIALAQFSRLREDWQRLSAEVFGHRLLMDTIVPGGVATEVTPENARRITGQCESIEAEVHRLRALLDGHAGVQDRFLGTGIVSTGLATQLGLTGLAARASGLTHDLRADHPHPPYDTLSVHVALQAGGDVAARAAVRFDEVLESLRLIRALCAQLPSGAHRIDVPAPEHAARGLGWVEGWRGEVLVALELGSDGAIIRCHGHDPSWQNWPVLEHAVIGNIVPDFPLINKSFNLSYSGHDL
jgi:Ni,Fe-hydrogenase III large subunit/Ni,Fe-hydrogenase III component G